MTNTCTSIFKAPESSSWYKFKNLTHPNGRVLINHGYMQHVILLKFVSIESLRNGHHITGPTQRDSDIK